LEFRHLRSLDNASWMIAFGGRPLSLDVTRFSQMAQTHPTSGVSAILVLSVLSFGLLTGAMLLIGISIVGFWKSLTPSDFVSWFASHSGRLGVIMIPLGTITLLVSLAAVAVSWRSCAKQRQRTVISALYALCAMVSYLIFFSPADSSVGALSDSAVRALFDEWWYGTGFARFSPWPDLWLRSLHSSRRAAEHAH
jgi:hypothetical protein